MPQETSKTGSGLPGLGALVRSLLAAREPLALLLDFDGTLARICDRPGDARPEPAALAALNRMSADTPIAIVSGRGLDDLQTLIAIPRATFFGSHGQEARFPGGQTINPFGESAPELGQLRGRIAAVAREFAGSWIEEKPQALVLHYRNLRDQGKLPDLRRRIQILAGEFPELSMMAGRKVFEFVPAAAPGKGGAVQWYLDRLDPGGNAPRIPVYFGDDVSDEGAFAAVDPLGIGVLVARRTRPTAAGYRLSGVNEVAAALTLLARGQSR
ncbi:MAG: trehalose-phosphatase [Chloroflexota bacterium]|nr:trehalose-phosphatase [Chloroflexota bacterium]